MKFKAPTRALKRASKHATLLSRLQETAPASKITKRRRPGNKLITNLEGLADALPEDVGEAGMMGKGARRKDGGDGMEDEGVMRNGMKIKHKSLRSRPGAGKKKEKLVALERERFARNIALMATRAINPSGQEKGNGGDGGSGTVMGKEGEMGVERDNIVSDSNEKGEGGTSKARWAAIRRFIEQTMERRDAEQG
ncbi:MAG: hypothetical protein Q9217_004947 [Psora testacea]